MTLIQIEAVNEFNEAFAANLPATAFRRNVITEGVDLNALEGRVFTVGDVQLRGVELCEPCAYLQKLLDIPGLVKQLTHKGGLRCEIRGGGMIRPGDENAAPDSRMRRAAACDASYFRILKRIGAGGDLLRRGDDEPRPPAPRRDDDSGDDARAAKKERKRLKKERKKEKKRLKEEAKAERKRLKAEAKAAAKAQKRAEREARKQASAAEVPVEQEPSWEEKLAAEEAKRAAVEEAPAALARVAANALYSSIDPFGTPMCATMMLAAADASVRASRKPSPARTLAANAPQKQLPHPVSSLSLIHI